MDLRKKGKWITYEEVVYDTRPIQTKEVLGVKWEQEYNESGRYTLNMVKIDDKIREIVTEIKLEEAKVAHRVNKIEDSQAQVSVAT